jgi:hypothetical protein
LNPHFENKKPIPLKTQPKPKRENYHYQPQNYTPKAQITREEQEANKKKLEEYVGGLQKKKPSPQPAPKSKKQDPTPHNPPHSNPHGQPYSNRPKFPQDPRNSEQLSMEIDNFLRISQTKHLSPPKPKSPSLQIHNPIPSPEKPPLQNPLPPPKSQPNFYVHDYTPYSYDALVNPSSRALSQQSTQASSQYASSASSNSAASAHSHGNRPRSSHDKYAHQNRKDHPPKSQIKEQERKKKLQKERELAKSAEEKERKARAFEREQLRKNMRADIKKKVKVCYFF